jgi:hypothetical protein
MSGLLTAGRITDEKRRAHDRHSGWTVAAVLALLFTYAYLFTHICYDLGLPAPQDVGNYLGITLAHVFDADHNVSAFIQIERTSLFGPNDDERLAYLLFLLGAFLSAYFLPLNEKKNALVFWSVLAIGALYGVQACLLMLCLHTVLYLILHPKQSLGFAALPGMLLWFAMSANHTWTIDLFSFWAYAPLISIALYAWLIRPLLGKPKVAAVLRTIAVQAAIIIVFIGTVYNGMLAQEDWKFPLGLLLFLFQWERIIMYHIDYKDGTVPEDISYLNYLSVFFSPGGIPNWTDRVCIAQGYAYLDNTFLCRDKNAIVMGGVRIMLVALGYLVLGDWFRYAAVDLFEAMGIPVFGGSTKGLVRYYMEHGDVGTLSVLSATMLNLFKWFIVFAAIGHFKVGVWRLCGYDVAPSFDKPWLATNLVSFWGRFTYHYREFLVRAFYYPVFFRYFRKHRKTRIVVATLASAGLGNMVWGHMVEIAYYRGMEPQALLFVAGHWPYYLLLGGGIALTELYLLKHKRKRKPWTKDRWIMTDLLAAYATLQFFALIHVFNRSAGGSTVIDQAKLFLIAFGIHL